ncbi:hypothetical protein SAMN05421767_11155 [Granulicatella balaenopterae]|uniref:Uncharacterized protein n=1 Tax=Granulicatella balaenopterae TaxID=137733 RepID=A0A1H9K352_9LACT|nr:hypothetical protein [Granulicatella balaenopterae]SEQ93626.1 hypothetical protein SAMN05421767_11155 [Granulicatella balaenopterae]
MAKVFEKAAIELYHDDLEKGRTLKFKTLGDVKEGVSEEAIKKVAKAVDRIAKEDMTYAMHVTRERCLMDD